MWGEGLGEGELKNVELSLCLPACLSPHRSSKKDVVKLLLGPIDVYSSSRNLVLLDTLSRGCLRLFAGSVIRVRLSSCAGPLTCTPARCRISLCYSLQTACSHHPLIRPPLCPHLIGCTQVQ